LLSIVGVAACCSVVGSSLRAVVEQPARGAGWAPFDCAEVPRHRGRDGQHLAELATIPYPRPERVEEFMANFRDWELRQSLAPDWQWVRHLPWLRNRYLTDGYGAETRAYFEGELDATLDWVENWHRTRCRDDYEDLRYAVVYLSEKGSPNVRAIFAFHADGTWGQASRPASPVPPLGLRIEAFRRRFREAFGEEPRDELLVTFPSPLCQGPTSPCVAAHHGDEVILRGATSDRLYRFDRTQPPVNEIGVGDQRAMAMIGDSVFRLLVPLPDG
jgi:hypothetical protein